MYAFNFLIQLSLLKKISNCFVHIILKISREKKISTFLILFSRFFGIIFFENFYCILKCFQISCYSFFTCNLMRVSLNLQNYLITYDLSEFSCMQCNDFFSYFSERVLIFEEFESDLFAMNKTRNVNVYCVTNILHFLGPCDNHHVRYSKTNIQIMTGFR